MLLTFIEKVEKYRLLTIVILIVNRISGIYNILAIFVQSKKQGRILKDLKIGKEKGEKEEKKKRVIKHTLKYLFEV